MNREINPEIFDRYLAGEMDVLEREAFQERLQSSIRISEALLLHRTIVEAVEETPRREAIHELNQQSRQARREQMEKNFAQYQQKKMTAANRTAFEKRLAEDDLLALEWAQYKQGQDTVLRRLRPVIIRLVSAAALLLMGLFAYWLISPGNSSSNSDHLYATYFERPSTDYARVGSKFDSKPDGPSAEDAFAVKQEGLAAFDNKQPLSTIEKLRQYLQLVPNISEDEHILYLYIGLARLELKEYKEGMEALTYGIANLTSSNTVLLKEMMQWHLALAYLKAGDEQQARHMLEAVIQSGMNDELKTKSEELLNSLP
ncbi:MAG: hypothetical protein AAFV25_08360 [Bacteroidota bacterium]